MQCRAYEERRMKLIAKAVSGRAVLDIGYAIRPNAYLAGREVVGLDLLAPPPGMPSCYRECIVGDALDAPTTLGGRTFDTVIASELIEHLERPYDFLRSLHGCLEPGGRLVLTTPNPLAPPVYFYELARSHKRYFTDDHVFYFPPRWMGRMLERTGYTLEALRGVGFGHPLFVVPAPVALSYQVLYIARAHD